MHGLQTQPLFNLAEAIDSLLGKRIAACSYIQEGEREEPTTVTDSVCLSVAVNTEYMILGADQRLFFSFAPRSYITHNPTYLIMHSNRYSLLHWTPLARQLHVLCVVLVLLCIPYVNDGLGGLLVGASDIVLATLREGRRH